MAARLTAFAAAGLCMSLVASAAQPALVRYAASEAPAREASDALTEAVDAVVDRALAEKRLVGAVVLVARDGQVVYRRAAGFADREEGRAMREDAIFRLASVTKPIVTVAAFRLVEQGRLRLEEPVTKWLPQFRPRLPDGSAPEITVHHLLTHTSGLSYRFFEPPDSPYHRLNVSDGLDQPGLSLEENLRRLAAVPLLFRPGERWHYSLATDVLGAVIAQAAGAPLPEVVRREVTGPLGMRDTSFVVTDRERLVTPYFDAKPEPARMTGETVLPTGEDRGIRFAPGRVFDPDSYPSGGAGMVGTAGDILKLLEAIRTGGGILQPQTVRRMTADQVGVQAATQGPGWGFAYGWAVLIDPETAGTPQTAGTIQWGGAYGHYWFIDPERRLSVVALTNVAFEGMSGAFTTQLRDAVYAALAR